MQYTKNRPLLGLAPAGIVAAQPVANAAATDIGIQQAFATRKVLRVIAVRQLPNIRALKCRKYVAEKHTKSNFVAAAEICVGAFASRE